MIYCKEEEIQSVFIFTVSFAPIWVISQNLVTKLLCGMPDDVYSFYCETCGFRSHNCAILKVNKQVE